MMAKRLLLVEDDRQLAELVRFHFDRAGYEVTRTGDGDEALILAEEVRPDLVILDWMIEGISGIEVCRRLRRRPATANMAPQPGRTPRSSVSTQIWNKVVSSSSRLYSAWTTPEPALITWTSPAPVRPLFPIESWWVIAPVRT